MRDPYELVGAMAILAVAGIMLVAGELRLLTNGDRAPVTSRTSAAVISSR